jgi:ankyrin repeat protein
MGINEQFLHACKNGDYRTVHHILDQHLITDIDITNQLGRTPMQLAIENEHLEVDEFNSKSKFYVLLSIGCCTSIR